MSAPQLFYWPSTLGNTDAIAPLQAIPTGNGFLKIQSNLPNMPNVPVNNSGIYQYDRMIRTISITSTDDISGVEFTFRGFGVPTDGAGNITGIFQELEEQVIGPPAEFNHTQTNNYYQKLYSVEVTDGEGQKVSIGFGSYGIINYIFPNLNQSAPQHWALQGIYLNGVDTFECLLNASLFKPEYISDQYGNLTPFPYPLPAVEFGSIGQGGYYIYSNQGNGAEVALAATLWASIVDTDLPNAGEFYLTFVQQGIAK